MRSNETLRYPAKLERDGAGYLVTFPDFDDAVTGGATREKALDCAQGALMEVIAARIAAKKTIPDPSPARGLALIALPPRTAAKALLYRAMREEGISKADLARRLGWKYPQVDRLFKVHYRTGLDQFEAAFDALGRHMIIGVT